MPSILAEPCIRALSQEHKGAFNNYVDKKRGWGSVQGVSSGFDIMYLALLDRNMQVIFGLKVVWEF